MNLKRILSFILCVIILIYIPAGAAAEDEEKLFAPSWVSEEVNYDGSKSVIIKTPTYMLDSIEYYEYSFDGGFTWNILNDSTGGEFIVSETSEFLLRYVSDGVTSEIYSVSIAIDKVAAIKSDSTDITALIPYGSAVPADVTLSAYEIINGTDYSAAKNAIGENKPFILFSVSLMRNNKFFYSDDEISWLFPIRNLDYRYCKLYYVGENGVLTEIDADNEMNMLYCTMSYKTGKFAVVEDKTNCIGDVNSDALVNASDARLALRASAKIETLSEIQFKSADTNSDGIITSSDARFILRIAAGLEKI